MDLRTASVFIWFTLNSTGSQHMILNTSAVYNILSVFVQDLTPSAVYIQSVFVQGLTPSAVYIIYILYKTSHLTSRLLKEDWRSWMPVDII